MIAAKNYDTICFHLKNNWYSQLHSPLKKDINRLSDAIQSVIISGGSIKSQPIVMLSQIFSIRFKALQWLTADNDSNIDFVAVFNDIFGQIEQLKSDSRFEVLAENILFALRCNQRVVSSFVRSNSLTSDAFSSNITHLNLTYPQFLASLAFANLDDDTAQKIIDFTNASLHIEFVMLATDIVSSRGLVVSDKTINELAFLIADAAQDYIALATSLGILKNRSPRPSFSHLSFDDSFLKQQHQLADLGLADFGLNLMDR